MHTSHPSETHYFPLNHPPPRRILLHTHGAAPYIRLDPHIASRGLTFTIYSTGSTGCQSDVTGFHITVDWSATLGRWGSRYFTTLASWAIGIVALLIFEAWGLSDKGGGKLIKSSSVFNLERALNTRQLQCPASRIRCRDSTVERFVNCCWPRRSSPCSHYPRIIISEPRENPSSPQSLPYCY